MKSLFSLLAVFLFGGITPVSGQQKLDARWLPWIGAWTPVVDSSTGSVLKSSPVVFIVPNPDGESVRVATAGMPLSEQDVLRPNGLRGPVSRAGCTGSREMRWSADGTRIFSRSELTCAGVERKMSGIMLLDRHNYRIDIQIEEEGQHPGVWVQRYLPSGSLPPEFLPPAQAASLAISANAERSKVSRVPVDAQDVIEGLQQVGSDAVEAMLVETGARFRMDSKLLTRLAAANVPERVIDIMVALSFPDRFVVEKGTVSPYRQPRAGGVYAQTGYWPVYSTFWYAAYPYGRYGFYDPWFGYGGYWQYYPYNGGTGFIGGTPSGHGIVVAGSGYTRISDRGSGGAAHPRYGRYSGGRSGSYSSHDYGSSSSSSSGGSSSGGSSGGSSSGGSVSSSGYSSGGSSGGGTAHARP